jgi:peptidoglycan/LPS O-acetylase OafA/YrhL
MNPSPTMAMPKPTAPAAGETTAPASPARSRNAALDFVKGALVLLMVVYHSFNYFHLDKDALRYLRFLPPSFIFIAGFLVTNNYLAKYDPRDSRMYWRLFIRGAKLLAIFIGLNLAVNTLFKVNYNQRQMGLTYLYDHLDSIFLMGEGRAAVFEVLLPISYLLLLSGALLKAQRRLPRFLPVTVVVVVVACLAVSLRQELPFNVDLLSMGLFGMLVGFVPIPRLDRFAVRVAPVFAAYLLYATAITYCYPTYALNMVGLCLTLLFLYAAGRKAGSTGFLARRVVLLGKYSLIAYIAQIAVLQLLHRALRPMPDSNLKLLVAMAITAVVTVAAIETLDFLRAKLPLANRIYQAIFA